MTARQFEAYVHQLISNLEAFKDAAISHDRRYAGVRQPGEYQIDVAVEFCLAGKLRLLVIIECKKWRRPVGRDVVQKLVQTRDAIAAQKAVICSPVGYTKEAIAVAEANGVALWVIAKLGTPVILDVKCMATISPNPEIVLAREELLEYIGLGLTSRQAWGWRLFDYSVVRRQRLLDRIVARDEELPLRVRFIRESDGQDNPLLDDSSGVYRLFMDALSFTLGAPLIRDEVQKRLEECTDGFIEMITRKGFSRKEAMAMAIEYLPIDNAQPDAAQDG